MLWGCVVLDPGRLLLSCVFCEDSIFYIWSVVDSGVTLCSVAVCFLWCICMYVLGLPVVWGRL